MKIIGDCRINDFDLKMYQFSNHEYKTTNSTILVSPITTVL